ncbi:MAG TPA: hypothetical protein PKL31_10380 [Fulvivirga sp.]|nr:hypothetical protein [Fulvivirga sp.]
MHFKKLYRIAVILLALSILLVGCKKDYDGTASIQHSINTVDELNQLVMGINFQGTLSNGMTIDFTPSQLYTNMEGNSFTNAQGFNYTYPITITSDGFGDGNASLDISGKIFSFPLLLCTTVKEISVRYPELQISPTILNYSVYFAAGNSKYTERDIIYGVPFQVDHMFTILVNPNETYLDGTFISSKGTYYDINGDYKINGKFIVSTGYAQDIFEDNKSESYTLLMRCSN